MKLSPEYLMTESDQWMIFLLDDCCMNNGYVYDCAGLLSFEILLVYCMLYIIFCILDLSWLLEIKENRTRKLGFMF